MSFKIQKLSNMFLKISTIPKSPNTYHRKYSLSINNPEGYEKFISFQKRDAADCLKKYRAQIKWREHGSVIDLGCGDGFVTANVLKPNIPENFKKLVGVDVSEAMVNHANKKYRNEKVSFDVMDIGGVLPMKYKDAFDHVFSSYALHFVIDQEQAFRNISDLLRKNGTCLILYSLRHPLVDAISDLSTSEKWKQYVNSEPVFPKYYLQAKNHPLIKNEVTRLMSECGFENIQVDIKRTSYKYDLFDDLLNMMQAANLFRLPEGPLLLDFMKDFEKVVQVTRTEDQPEAATMEYDQIVAFGKKAK